MCQRVSSGNAVLVTAWGLEIGVKVECATASSQRRVVAVYALCGGRRAAF